MTKPMAIEVVDAHFQYPDGHHVLKGISCTIREGEKIALIGPNGAGKSTFMSLLNGVSLPTSGKVLIGGLEVKKENLVKIRRKVGIVFQDPDDQLFCPTVFDDVAFGPLNLGLPREQIKQRVEESLGLVGLNGFEERSSFHLSFGERKRLALATVLSYQPDILVFDEPSTNMDPMNRRKLIKWLQQSGKTMLLCTHDLDIALEVCDRCLLLSDGKFVADGKASDILYDKALLEQYHLELPLALMTHELLEEKLRTGKMDEEHKRIISSFLHVHRHVHGPEGQEHLHVHFHEHGHEHLHEEIAEQHLQEAHGEEHAKLKINDLVQHSHDQKHANVLSGPRTKADPGHNSGHDRGHSHDHGHHHDHAPEPIAHDNAHHPGHDHSHSHDQSHHHGAVHEEPHAAPHDEGHGHLHDGNGKPAKD